MKIVISTDEQQPNASYRGALLSAGALPEEVLVVSPGVPLPADLDGLLLAGGPDVHPGRYGEVPCTPTLEVRDARDDLDLALLKRAERAGAPVFGICRGLQVVNVALGGTLWQDLPAQRERGVAHAFHREDGFAPDHPAHPVRSARQAYGGPFDDLFAAVTEVTVNSRHHQAVKELAPGLLPLATSPDELVEAAGRPGRFFAAVQWHPEDLVAEPFHKALFRGFVGACRAFAKERGRPGPPPVEVRLFGSVPVVRLNRPASGNAFTAEMAGMLAETVQTLCEDPTVPALVLTGNGPAFCSGFDGDVLAALLHAGDEPGFAEALHAQARLSRMLLEVPRPVVAAIDGPVAGAGLAVALACDVRVASASVASLGPTAPGAAAADPRVDGGLAFLLSEAAGSGAAADALYSTEPFPLNRARELRLLDHVVEDEPALRLALSRAALYAETPVSVLAACKRLLVGDRLRRLDEAVEREARLMCDLFRRKGERRTLAPLSSTRTLEVS